MNDWKATPLPNMENDDLFVAIITTQDGRQLIAQCTSVEFAEEIVSLRATVAAQEKVIALNKYVTPPFDLCDDDTIELALECVKKDETIAKQAQTIETARERVTLLESVVTESCGDHPENSCESWCDQCKRGADALRKAFAANAPTPTQGETEGAPKFDSAQEYRDALEKIESVWVGESVTDEHIAALKMYTIAARALNNADDETESEA